MGVLWVRGDTRNFRVCPTLVNLHPLPFLIACFLHPRKKTLPFPQFQSEFRDVSVSFFFFLRGRVGRRGWLSERLNFRFDVKAFFLPRNFLGMLRRTKQERQHVGRVPRGEKAAWNIFSLTFLFFFFIVPLFLFLFTSVTIIELCVSWPVHRNVQLLICLPLVKCVFE